MVLTKYSNFMNLLKKAEAALIRSNQDRKHAFRLCQLATYNGEYPELRTVVKRRMLNDWQFLIYTDRRSPKAMEIEAHPSVSLHFYDSRKQLQVRIRGQAELQIEGTLFEQELQLVQQMPSVQDYTSLLPPSSPLEMPLQHGSFLHFGLILIKTAELDVLELSREGHQRALYRRGIKGWEEQLLVP